MSIMDTVDTQPLTPAVFHILLALARGDKHGYEIMKFVRQDSNGTVKMGNGTLYGSLKRMLTDGLIADTGEKSADDETTRRYYTLTALGHAVLNAEMERYLHTSEVIKNLQRASHLQPAEGAI